MSVVRRLPRYLRFLTELETSGKTRISSKELAEEMGLTASQIRQDFNCFGGFGQQGYGYHIPQLRSEIEKILGLGNHYKCVLIGAGNLGRAIVGHMPFQNLGFELIGVFDNSPSVIGRTISSYPVLDYSQIGQFCSEHKPIMAILCVPREAVEKISDELYDIGIRSFWNFGHYDISLKHEDVTVENVHMNDSMMTLCYLLTQTEPQE